MPSFHFLGSDLEKKEDLRQTKNKHFELQTTRVLDLEDSVLLECQTSRRLSLNCIAGDMPCARKDAVCLERCEAGPQGLVLSQKQWAWNTTAGAEAAARAPGCTQCGPSPAGSVFTKHALLLPRKAEHLLSTCRAGTAARPHSVSALGCCNSVLSRPLWSTWGPVMAPDALSSDHPLAPEIPTAACDYQVTDDFLSYFYKFNPTHVNSNLRSELCFIHI